MQIDSGIAKFEEVVLQQLDKHSFFGYSMRFSNPYYATPALSSFFNNLVSGLSYGFFLEEHFDKFVAMNVDDMQKRAIVASETSKKIVGKSVELDESFGQNTKLDFSMFGGLEWLISDYSLFYKKKISEKLIYNERLAIRFSYDYFKNVILNVQEAAGEYKVNDGGSEEESFFVRSFDEVVGLDLQKDIIIRQLINPFKYSKKWEKLRKKTKQVRDHFTFLFYGPAGGGKTYFAQSIAGELQVPFISVTGSDFVAPHLGEGKNKLQSVYEQAAQTQQAVVYIDEADVLCLQRGNKEASLKLDLITQFLSILDGVKTQGQVATIMSTNQVEVFDSAILSRIPIANRLVFEEIDLQTKKKIFLYHLDNFYHEQIDVNYFEEFISSSNPRSLSQVASLAGLFALQRDDEVVRAIDVSSAIHTNYVSRVGEKSSYTT